MLGLDLSQLVIRLIDMLELPKIFVHIVCNCNFPIDFVPLCAVNFARGYAKSNYMFYKQSTCMPHTHAHTQMRLLIPHTHRIYMCVLCVCVCV